MQSSREPEEVRDGMVIPHIVIAIVDERSNKRGIIVRLIALPVQKLVCIKTVC